ncbi:Uncharacterised protein [Mycobacteroides abscessus subsp. abscessus]|nr:Uncharacterised protein [Mycobacteroides abscessus subsp. abscessus]
MHRDIKRLETSIVEAGGRAFHRVPCGLAGIALPGGHIDDRLYLVRGLLAGITTLGRRVCERLDMWRPFLQFGECHSHTSPPKPCLPVPRA